VQIVKRYQVRGASGSVTSAIFDGRRVDFWAPHEPTPVLSVTHDGQNIFDKSTSTRHRTWELAGTANKVAREFGVTPPIIIAVFHSGNPKDPYGRGKDLAPEDVFKDGVLPALNFPGIWPTPEPSFPLSELRGNAYLEQITHSILPAICSHLSHELIPDATAMLGASMGGLTSLNGVVRYPDIYRTALSFSPHWTVGKDPLVEKLMSALPHAGKHKIWMSRGTKSHDANYGPYQGYANNIAISLGYRYGHDLATPVFKRTTHKESSWGSYVNQALRFWLTPKN